MASVFDKLFGERKSSKETAKERLQLVLIHDRASLSPGMVEDLKRDLIQVLSKYMDFNESALEVQMDNKDEVAMLAVNIPISNLKRTY